LDRALHALDLICSGKPVPRGTIQTQWLIKSFDDCCRLGLTADWEASTRKACPDENGMLVAERVLPEGPACGKILVGDILLMVNDQIITQFVRLEDLLDSNVGQVIRLLVQRSSEQLQVKCRVDDLCSITPDRFITVAGGVFHDLSYQQARLYGIAPRGVYVSEASGSFDLLGDNRFGYIIDSINSRTTQNLHSFQGYGKNNR
jgi:pro-apoptotic serine protease NMA111